MLTSLPYFINKEKWANMFSRTSTGYQEVCVCVCCWGGGEGGQSNQRLRLAVVSDQLTNTFPKDNDNQNNFPYNIGVDRVA